MSASAFAAIALSAVAWDGVLSRAGSRALRHSLDYRPPFDRYGDERMVQLMDGLLSDLRRKGPQFLIVEAAEIMRSDGPLQDDERNILANLAETLALAATVNEPVLAVMEVLHARVLDPQEDP